MSWNSSGLYGGDAALTQSSLPTVPKLLWVVSML